MSTTTLPRTVTIRIPATPSRALSPNRPRGMHWSETHEAKHALKAATTGAMLNTEPLPMFSPPVGVAFDVYWGKGRKRMDDDNLLASLKFCLDAIADYIGVNDKHFRYIALTQDRDPDGFGFMDVRLEGATA